MVTDLRASRGDRGRGQDSVESIAREALLAEVAMLYYVDQYTQEEIARRIGKSIATVSRLLAKAEATNVVEVSVRYPIPIVPALQAALAERFGLRTARVVRVARDDAHTLIPQISDLAARYVSTILRDGAVVAVAWGSTVRGVVYAIAPGHHRDVHVVQGLGSLGSRLPTIDNPLLIQVLAERIEATPHFLPAPMIVESESVRDALIRDPHFSASLALCGRADIALIGIGHTDPEQSGLCRAGYLEPWAMERIRASGAVGDMMVEFYDLDGRILETDFGPRVMGMREPELRNTGTVVAVAGGTTKVAAILGALRTGMIDVLVTDNVTARQVLELDDARPARDRPQGDPIASSRSIASAGVLRSETTRRAILGATLAILEREGYQRLSIDAVATAAAVEQTTIYRWWKSKVALVQEALAEAAVPPPSNTGNLREDLESILRPFVTPAPDRGQRPGLAHKTMMAEAQLDPEFHRVYFEFQQTLRNRVIEALERGRDRGELAIDGCPDALADMLLGALWFRLLMEHASPNRAILHDLIATVVAGEPSHA